MGMMDSMINKATGAGIPQGTNPILSAALHLIGNAGGISGLTQRFQNQGLGQVAQSWVGTGPNMPIEGHQLEKVFGRDQLESAAQQSGMPMSDLTHQLSSFLPNLVNEATPNGQVPQGQPNMQNLLSMGMRLLGR